MGQTALSPLVIEPFDDMVADGSVPLAEISQVVRVSRPYSCLASKSVVAVETRSRPNESTVDPAVPPPPGNSIQDMVF